MRYALDPPEAPLPGLGLRRVQWTTNELNMASRRAAERLGFSLEGIMRWVWVLPEGKGGLKAGDGDPHPEMPGRHSASFSLCWDDWQSGKREKMLEMMNRVQQQSAEGA